MCRNYTNFCGCQRGDYSDTTMIRSKQSFTPNPLYPIALFQTKRHKIAKTNISKGSNATCINGDENHEAFKQCLLRVPPNIWFKITDVEGDNLGDIFYATSIPSHILVTIMINLEYMIYVKNKLKINVVKWQGFFTLISLDERFHFATFQPRGEGICY